MSKRTYQKGKYISKQVENGNKIAIDYEQKLTSGKVSVDRAYKVISEEIKTLRFYRMVSIVKANGIDCSNLENDQARLFEFIDSDMKSKGFSLAGADDIDDVIDSYIKSEIR